MSKTLKYGFIGTGSIMQHRHLPECHQGANMEVAAVADPVEDRARSTAEKYKATAYFDHAKMLAEADLDAVVVGSPNAFHAPHTIEALQAGCHVLCEKPMAGNVKAAREMIAAAEKAGKYLMIGMNQRLMPPHVKAKQVLDRGELGKVLAFETNFKHAGPDGWSIDGAKSWFFKKDLAVMGVNGDLGIHKADLMRFLLGEEFTHVGGFVTTLDKKTPDGQPISVDDNAYLTLKTQSGTIGSIHISWTNYGHISDNGTVLHCEHGVMRIGMDETYGVMVDFRDGRKERYVVGAMATNEKQLPSGVIDSFTHCILNQTPPTIDGQEGLRALTVITTAIEAASEGVIKEIKY